MQNCFVKSCFATDYGINGDKKIEQYREAQGIRNRTGQRIFCLDCLQYRKCRGRKFPNCPEAKEFFETLNTKGVKLCQKEDL